MLTLGKPIAGGIPAAAFGLTAEVAERIQACAHEMDPDCGGIGGTLAGNALSLAAMRATLHGVLNEEFYRRTIPLARRFAAGVRSVIAANRLPWHVVQLGCRVEYRFCAVPSRNGRKALAAVDTRLDRYVHLALMNRGILLTPFHNMVTVENHWRRIGPMNRGRAITVLIAQGLASFSTGPDPDASDSRPPAEVAEASTRASVISRPLRAARPDAAAARPGSGVPAPGRAPARRGPDLCSDPCAPPPGRGWG